jgi:hypothetical protein
MCVSKGLFTQAKKIVTVHAQEKSLKLNLAELFFHRVGHELTQRP